MTAYYLCTNHLDLPEIKLACSILHDIFTNHLYLPEMKPHLLSMFLYLQSNQAPPVVEIELLVVLIEIVQVVEFAC